MDVGDLLQLQRSFQRDRIVHAAAEEEEVLRAVVFVGQRFDVLLLVLEDVLDLVRDHAHLVHPLAQNLVALAAEGPDVEREEIERRELRGEGLRRRHADLRAGVRVDGAVRHARGGGTDDVADREELRPLRLGLLHAGDRVGGLARLRHADDEGVLVDDRVAVAVLRTVVDLDGDAGRILEEELADQAGVP